MVQNVNKKFKTLKILNKQFWIKQKPSTNIFLLSLLILFLKIVIPKKKYSNYRIRIYFFHSLDSLHFPITKKKTSLSIYFSTPFALWRRCKIYEHQSRLARITSKVGVNSYFLKFFTYYSMIFSHFNVRRIRVVIDIMEIRRTCI